VSFHKTAYTGELLGYLAGAQFTQKTTARYMFQCVDLAAIEWPGYICCITNSSESWISNKYR